MPSWRWFRMLGSLIRDKGREGRRGYTLPKLDVEETNLDEVLPENARRKEKPRLAEVDEPTVIRHYTNLSRRNWGIDTNFYPLGSCTMKHNPRANEAAAAVPGFAGLHPLQPEEQTQGALRVMHEVQGFLAEISGLPAVSLQPMAGAQGELTSILMIRKYFEDAGDHGRTTVIVPETAHGTNPATATMANFKAVEVGLDEHGCVEVDELREMVDETTAALMITNPNTCGVFERNIKEISDVLHEAGAFLYMDGANMNANMGRMRASDAGVDIMHFNLHKTYSTPHGGGGPGSGAIACSEDLAPFRPDPVVEKQDDNYTFVRPDKSIGRIAAFHGNFGQVLRAWNYIKMHGPELKDVTDMAVLNANYVRARLRGTYRVPYDELCKHEVVVQPPKGKKALDIAKGLIDHGFHPPTIYFPLVVKEAMLIEPTETESKETLDDFVGAMLELAESDPEELEEAPKEAPTRRLDEARAARQLKARW
jgi:glycine dehydrogenase subunit 2